MTKIYREQAPAPDEDDGLECYFVVIMYKKSDGIHYLAEYARSFDRLGAYREVINRLNVAEESVLRFSVASVVLILDNNKKIKYAGKTISNELND